MPPPPLRFRSIVAGSRLFAVIVSSLLYPLAVVPVVPSLLLLAYSLTMVRSNPTLCAAPLLTHPLTAQRIRSFHGAMRLLTLMLPGGEPSAAASRS